MLGLDVSRDGQQIYAACMDGGNYRVDPETGMPVTLRRGPYGAYVQLGPMAEAEVKVEAKVEAEAEPAPKTKGKKAKKEAKPKKEKKEKPKETAAASPFAKQSGAGAAKGGGKS